MNVHQLAYARTLISLKNRFRHLKQIEFWDDHFYTKLIIACCIRHNLCIDGGDEKNVGQRRRQHTTCLQSARQGWGFSSGSCLAKAWRAEAKGGTCAGGHPLALFSFHSFIGCRCAANHFSFFVEKDEDYTPSRYSLVNGDCYDPCKLIGVRHLTTHIVKV